MVLAKNPQTKRFELSDKMLVHLNGWQHYAFSVFIFNSKFELLLQKRASSKYHSGGLWTNTCCSHPLSDQKEEIEMQAIERLQEEMGFKCPIQYSFTFEYNQYCSNGLTENEIDFVFFGFSDIVPKPDPEEVEDYKWISLENLRTDIEENENQYTEWIKIIINQNFDVLKHWETESQQKSTIL